MRKLGLGDEEPLPGDSASTRQAGVPGPLLSLQDLGVFLEKEATVQIQAVCPGAPGAVPHP